MIRPCTRRVPQCGDSAHSDVSAVLINQQLTSYERSLRVRIPPAPPASSFQISGLQLWFLSRHPQLGNIGDQLERELRLCFSLLCGSLLGVSQSASLSSAFVYNWLLLTSMVRGMHQQVVSLKGSMVNGAASAELPASRELVAKRGQKLSGASPLKSPCHGAGPNARQRCL